MWIVQVIKDQETKWKVLYYIMKLPPFSINAFELNAASVQLPVAQFLTGSRTALYSLAADNVSPCALLCFNYAWHSLHTIIQWQRIGEMQLHLKSNKSEDKCNYIVTYYNSEARRFLGLIHLWLTTTPLPFFCFDSVLRTPQPIITNIPKSGSIQKHRA